MGPHEEFLELCAAAIAGELSADEQARLAAHLASCPACRQAKREYEAASDHVVAALAAESISEESEQDRSWSVEIAEKSFLKRRDSEKRTPTAQEGYEPDKRGQRFTYRPSRLQWPEVWMSLAAVVLLALALAVTAYRSGVKHGTDIAQTTVEPSNDRSAALEEQVSDAGHEHAQLLAELAEKDKLIADLRRQVSEQQKAIGALKTSEHSAPEQQSTRAGEYAGAPRDEESAAAQAKLVELQKTIDNLTAQREEITSRAAILDAKVGELTQLVRDRERELDQKEEQVAKDQDLLEHDRDIRELMGARDLYIAEIHDVSGTGETNKTYGRIFYTRGKRLIFYAYDLDAQPGVRSASTFQAWGRRGPDKQRALNLGVFYEDNVAKKRWVLKAADPKTLEDIDAVFVTVEPNGGSPHPSGKQLLFALLRLNPNHP
jgi:hypothetical protein